MESSISCPNCRGLRIGSSEAIIEELGKTLETKEKLLSAELDSQIMTQTLLERREGIAYEMFADPLWVRESDALEWFSLSYLLAKSANLSETLSVEPAKIDHFTSLAREVVKDKARLLSLRQGLEVPLVLDGELRICRTEKCLLDYVPQDVVGELSKEIPLDEEEIAICIPRHGLSPEAVLAHGLAMGPVVTTIKSGILARTLKRVVPIRVLPFLKSKEACKSFVEVANALISFASRTLGQNWQVKKGVLSISNDPKEIAALLGRKVPPKTIHWFITNIAASEQRKDLPLRIIVNDERNGLLYIPSYTLIILNLSLYRWSGIGRVGDSLNIVGGTMENYIFVFLNSYELETRHPITNKPLVNVPHPERNEEIADVMAYNSRYVFVIESKFWDAPLLSDIEVELEKFSKKIEYIKSNLDKFGITPPKIVLPVFYTLFPPYAMWGDIRLFPSVLAIGFYLNKIVERKELKLLSESPELKRALDSVKDSSVGSIDAHEIDHEIEENRFRIQEGVVRKYDEKEVTVKIQNPFGYPFEIAPDLTEKTYREMKEAGIKEGDTIRMGLVNISGTWSITQFLYFVPVSRPLSEQVPDIELRRRQLGDLLRMYDEEAFREQTQAFFASQGIDLGKLQKCCDEKDLDIHIAVASILAVDVSTSKIVQCKCGEVMWFDNKLYESLRKTFPNEIVKCKRCDSLYFQKLSIALDRM